MLTSSFISEEGIDIEIAGGTPSGTGNQGSDESVETKANASPEQENQEGQPTGKQTGDPPDGAGGHKGDDHGEEDVPKGKEDSRNGIDRVQRRFDRLKRNHQAKIQKRDARIAALQADLEKANAELERLRKGKENGSASDEQIAEARIDAGVMKRDLERERQALEEERAENMRELIGERIDALYPSEKHKASYSEAIAMGKRNGAFDSAMKDGVVRNFLVDSDLGPKLTEHFCRRPDVLDDLLSMSEDRRKHELYAMEARLKAFLAGGGKKKDVKGEDKDKKPAGAQPPAIGKQANRGASKGGESDFATDDDVFDFVRGNR